jgi:hypothetical protein
MRILGQKTVPARNFNVLLSTNPSGDPFNAAMRKILLGLQTGNFTGDATEGFSLMGEHGMGVPAV